MNILKVLFTIFIILVIIKMFLDFLSIGKKNIIEGMESKEGPDPTEEDCNERGLDHCTRGR